MIRNERLKLGANFLSAVGLGLIAIAVLRPIFEADDYSARALALWAVAGLAMHGVSHYILGYLR
jgi:hypothetical protein